MPLQLAPVSRSAGPDWAPTRALFRLDGPADRPPHLLVGCSTEGNIDLAADVIREWIAGEFGQSFEQSEGAADSSIATAAFYDEIDRWFRDRVFVAAVHLDSPKGRPGRHRLPSSGAADEMLEAVDELGPITWAFQGLVRVLFNRENGNAQVTLDELPGALTFVGSPSWVPCGWSGAGETEPLAQASTCYAFGWAPGAHTDFLVKLRNEAVATVRAGHEDSRS